MYKNNSFFLAHRSLNCRRIETGLFLKGRRYFLRCCPMSARLGSFV